MRAKRRRFSLSYASERHALHATLHVVVEHRIWRTRHLPFTSYQSPVTSHQKSLVLAVWALDNNHQLISFQRRAPHAVIRVLRLAIGWIIPDLSTRGCKPYCPDTTREASPAMTYRYTDFDEVLDGSRTHEALVAVILYQLFSNRVTRSGSFETQYSICEDMITTLGV